MTGGSPPADNPRALKADKIRARGPMATGCLKSRRPCLPSTEPSTTPAPAAGDGLTMAGEEKFRGPLIHVFDRVLDQGVLFDAVVRLSPACIQPRNLYTD